MHYGKLQSVPNCFLRSDSNSGNKRGEEKRVVAEKMKSAPMFQQGNSKVRHHGRGGLGVHQLTNALPQPHLSSYPKHTPRSDLRLNNKAKCCTLPPPRNITSINKEKMWIGRKDKNLQREKESG